MRYHSIHWLAILCCFLTSAGRTTAAPPIAYPAPAAAPAPAQTPDAGARMDHLLQAAAHLEAAGLPEKAAECRRMAEQERGSLLIQLDALQAKVQRLRQLVAPMRQILVHLQVEEVSLTRLKAKNDDLSRQFGAPDGIVCQVSSPEETQRKLESLRADDTSKILASPTMVTVSGRPVHFQSGGTIPMPEMGHDGKVATRTTFYGTMADLAPTFLGGDRVRLEFHLKVAELDPAHSVKIGDQTAPGLRVREVESAAELRFGQTVVVSGMIQQHEDPPEERATIFLLRPELVEP
jgi:Flp pilus assembly secretin CpaC